MATPRVERVTLLGLAQAGQRLVAVGEHGVALYSDDDGRTWRQSAVPVSVTLTVVRFADATHGWAAGHNGVLLRTDDAGASWQRVLDGRDVIRLYQQAADRIATGNSLSNERSQLAQSQAARLAARLAEDGPDKPWLDLTVDSAGRLWLAGANGLLLRSEDGRQWEAWSSHLGDPVDRHLYAVQTRGEEIVIAGEQGVLLRSIDGGEHFESLCLPYRGSLFTLQLGEDGMTVAGLQGNVFRSIDGGRSFVPVPLPAPVSITASLRMPDGGTLLANQAGDLYRLHQGTLLPLGVSAGSNPSALTLAADGSLVSAGSHGPSRIAALPTMSDLR
ncbi:WD40/YVTN/BNR-like repeat-containing protein [Azospirillum sp. B510]|uniref:WD40/YVTN/BNR-like repeat-containing protein n=1 Tax=Azospirillum sp. (strain B510) TaxID=137722 RepID=UPI00130519F7|nr:YCF48-related protein [Azospirillum sp. B510]